MRGEVFRAGGDASPAQCALRFLSCMVSLPRSSITGREFGSLNGESLGRQILRENTATGGVGLRRPTIEPLC